jgi:HK97 family phage portal protein
MGFLDRLWPLQWKSTGEPIRSSLDLFREVYGSRASIAGVTVNWKTALQVATMLACCRVVAEGVSQIPYRLYQETGSGKTVAKDHPLNRLLYRKPNGWQTSFEWRETIIFHLMLTFNAYIFVNRVGINREVREMIPIEPGRVTPRQRDDYSIVYKVRGKNGAEQEFGQDAIWHLRGPSWNTWVGMDATALAANALGLSISLEQGQSDAQKNAVQTSGVFSVKDKLAPEKFDQLAAWMDKHMPGGDRAGKPMILDMEADFKRILMSAVDQQLIETRKHQIEEICRGARVWPIMVGHAGDQSPTFASAEQFFLAHVVHTLMPWYSRIEQSADVNLLTKAEIAAGYYTKFTPNALMRGAAKDRGEFYAKALGSGGSKGWMTQNDVRALEDLDRSDDPEADKLPQPVVAAPKPVPANDQPAPGDK